MTTPVDVSTNLIPVHFGVQGRLVSDAADRFTEPHLPVPLDLRATPLVVLSADTAPVIVRGLPTAPAYAVTLPVTVQATQGAPDHIYVKDNPNPVWDPGLSEWEYPPPSSGVGDYRWTVYDLLDPTSDPSFTDGQYLLGDYNANDDSANYPTTAPGVSPCFQWSASAPNGGPAWHSQAPFKPTVSGKDVIVNNGQKYNHPRGVCFSMSTDCHMWLDMGAIVAQPFTWVIVAMQADDTDNLHTILDSGKNPFSISGAPAYTEKMLGDILTVNDGLSYRTTLHVSGQTTAIMNTAVSQNQGNGVFYSLPPRAVLHAPRMYGMVYNGSNSMLWVKGTDVAQVVHGTVATGTGFQHRYYVLGRRNGYLSQDMGCEMYVFEMRFWKKALTEADMADQYSQLSSTYLFDAYKGKN
jgi:hypothetical protein